jgi:hypothetical protein
LHAATVRVRFAFEFAETQTLPRTTTRLPNSISDKKKLIKFGDL